MRTTGWVIMTFLSVAVAAYAAAVLLVPGFGPPFVADRRAIVPLAVLAHLAGGLAPRSPLAPGNFTAGCARATSPGTAGSERPTSSRS